MFPKQLKQDFTAPPVPKIAAHKPDYLNPQGAKKSLGRRPRLRRLVSNQARANLLNNIDSWQQSGYII